MCWGRSLSEELAHFNSAAMDYTQAYHSFLHLSRVGDFEAAERAQAVVLSLLEVSMDAFTRACRLQNEMMQG